MLQLYLQAFKKKTKIQPGSWFNNTHCPVETDRCRAFSAGPTDRKQHDFDFKRAFSEPVRRFDPLFESNGIHPNPERGMGVLARFYIRAIHSRYFNPYVYQ
jgi:hypothetical protein